MRQKINWRVMMKELQEVSEGRKSDRQKKRMMMKARV
jgi:hypothetical protein